LQRRMSAGRLWTWGVVSGLLVSGAWLAASRIEKIGQPADVQPSDDIDVDPLEVIGANLTYSPANPCVIQVGCAFGEGWGRGLGCFIRDQDRTLEFLTAFHVVDEGTCIIAPWSSGWYDLDTVTRGSFTPDAAVFAVPQDADPSGALTWSDRLPILGEPVTVYRWVDEAIVEIKAHVVGREYVDGLVRWAVDVHLGPGSSGGPMIAADGRVLGVLTRGQGERSYFCDVMSILKQDRDQETIAELRAKFESEVHASKFVKRVGGLLENGQTQEAAEILRGETVGEFSSEETAAELANAYLVLGNTDRALEILEAASSKLGDDAGASLNALARVYSLKSEGQRVHAILNKLLAKGRISHENARFMLGSVGLREQSVRKAEQYPESKHILARMIELFPADCELYAKQRQFGIETNSIVMPPEYCLNQSIECRDVAIRHFGAMKDRSRIADLVDRYGVEGLSSYSLWAAGGAMHELGRSTEGLLFVERAWAADPVNYRIAEVLGEHFRDTEDHGRAAAYLAIASENAPVVHSSHAAAAFHMMSRCTWEETREVLDRLPIADASALDRDMYNRARILYETGQHAEAMNLIEQCEFIHLPALLRLACVIASELQRHDDAAMYGRFTLEAGEDIPELREWLEQFE
jgi:thioredoxin-like negative regulator of GroEL